MTQKYAYNIATPPQQHKTREGKEHGPTQHIQPPAFPIVQAINHTLLPAWVQHQCNALQLAQCEL